MRTFCITVVFGCLSLMAVAQEPPSKALVDSVDHVDSDHDGLSDWLESSLLRQFEPQLHVSKDDCAVKPASFMSANADPLVLSPDGTLYGQGFRHSADEIELHYYHLWAKDCGEMGHALDAEHVSVLLRKDIHRPDEWKAAYWYAAAHEDTVCDASQLTRASTIHAENQGAAVWVSAGKHASFLDEELCRRGCGGDRCHGEEKLSSPDVVDVGSLDYPENGALWIRSAAWPLAAKMGRSDFTEARIARLERLPQSDIAWANPAKRPGQAVIAGGNATVNGVAIGGRSTDAALSVANDKTGGALSTAAGNTGHSLQRGLGSTWNALRSSAKHTGQSLGIGRLPKTENACSH